MFCLASGVLSLVSCALRAAVRAEATDVPYLVWIGVGPMGAAFYLWDRALKRGDPRVVGTLAYLTPLLSTLLIAAFGEGHITAVSALCMAMIVGGAWLGGVS
jgi:drug/metabolite transporter (DMT)-like permease